MNKGAAELIYIQCCYDEMTNGDFKFSDWVHGDDFGEKYKDNILIIDCKSL